MALLAASLSFAISTMSTSAQSGGAAQSPSPISGTWMASRQGLSPWILNLQTNGNRQAEQLKTSFPGLGIGKAGVWHLWQPQREGYEDWFIGAFADSRLVAIGAADVIESVAFSAGPQFHVGDEGEPLNPRLPGLRVALSGESDSAVIVVPASVAESPAPSLYGLPASPEWLFRASLAFVMALSLFSAHLLWRNTTREVRMAEMRSQFVSNVSHELRTPLTSIRMFAELLQEHRPADPEDAKNHAEYLEMIVNESERLTRLLNNVLDFSSIEHGQKDYRMEPTRLDEVVTAVARTMKYPLAQKGFDLRVRVDDAVPTVDACYAAH
jgi:signal transduction histidine kinase